MHTCIFMYIYVYMYIYTHTCACHTHTHTQTCTHTYTYILHKYYTCMYMHIYTCMHLLSLPSLAPTLLSISFPSLAPAAILYVCTCHVAARVLRHRPKHDKVRRRRGHTREGGHRPPSGYHARPVKVMEEVVVVVAVVAMLWW